ncbi:MAG: UTP--glucose-1-phosphate uridylyltransferase, partial [Alphaproteobacteria bacterium]|nr:UTP--glucose-1-phosphate uridylyltransferase [Alphaproteobacteria bacterium]
LHITGRYILQPEIFDFLGKQEAGVGGEIQLTDSMLRLKDDLGQGFFADRYEGEIHDCGSKIGFLTANIAYALARNDDLARDLRAEMKRMTR